MLHIINHFLSVFSRHRGPTIRSDPLVCVVIPTFPVELDVLQDTFVLSLCRIVAAEVIFTHEVDEASLMKLHPPNQVPSNDEDSECDIF